MRYMFNNCQDAMAICKRFGYPDLFITMTCNANWKEIQDFVTPRGLRADDRPDIVARVFKMKLNDLMSNLKKGKIFGEVQAGTYTIEFQKRGLPHAHILIWLQGEGKLKTGDDIDKVISAEFPDPVLYPALSAAVSNYMMHGPCGFANMNYACMKNGKCEKFFPKQFQNSTTIDEEGYPKYRRRDTGVSVTKKDIVMDNRYVVPYNPDLLMRYHAHINVEYCNKSNSIKYLFKYVNKGPDRVSVEISNRDKDSNKEKGVDEINQYYDCKYLSPCEAAWRIFGFYIHDKWPPVNRLSFHLPNEQSVTFKDHEWIDTVVERNQDMDTEFTTWFKANQESELGKDLTYAEFPQRFVYDEDKRIWTVRKKGFSIGRLNYIPMGTGELFYMRVLLTIQKGCTSFDSIKTVNGVLYQTYKEVCYILGLLKDDREYIDGIKEASDLGSGPQLR
ncbi:uncharacterized protein LOC130725830 [Lotus japonicus]|uniref:uncharacterized protein LOC130725830 n=1 Tax=Lotus japonicus TaxID=34305 RepID=UPI002585F4A0|nr:uncharacterized protein LOC130725830 [Lotus japonicus]